MHHAPRNSEIIGLGSAAARKWRRAQNRDVRQNQDRRFRVRFGQISFEPVHLLRVDVARVPPAFGRGLNAVEDDKMPAVPVERAIPAADAHLLHSPSLAVKRVILSTLDAPHVVVADAVFDGQRIISFHHRVPGVPLLLHGGAVLRQRVHNRVAPVQDKPGFVGLILRVTQAFGNTFHRGFISRDVRIANVSKPDRAFAQRIRWGDEKIGSGHEGQQASSFEEGPAVHN